MVVRHLNQLNELLVYYGLFLIKPRSLLATTMPWMEDTLFSEFVCSDDARLLNKLPKII
jgi:hypothetical protein